MGATGSVFHGIDEVRAAVGTHLGYSDWLEVAQERIDRFADATGDRQWIHVDPGRARSGPFGTTIAHGYLTLSLVSCLLPQVIRVEGVSLGVNYGTGRLRFPSPVPAGSRIRAGGDLIACDDVPGGIQATTLVTLELEGSGKPACVVETLSRYLV